MAVGDSWVTLVVAPVLSVLFTQVVFLGHDAGHQQVTGSRRINRLLGLVAGNALTGVSFGWWVPKHNAHHAYPNQVGRDPDLGGGLVGFSAGTATSGPCSLAKARRARLEKWLFVPVLLLQGLGLRVTGAQSVLRRRSKVEAVLLLANATGFVAAVFLVLSPTKALAFVAVQQGLFGLYLGCTFAPNHKGMPIVAGDAEIGFVRRQVATARNVAGGRVVTLMFGGLNYQIEHHLFPTMPRPNLARAQVIVSAFCCHHDLAYREDRIIDSYRTAFQGLARPALLAQPAPV
ncbi:MAG: fatty acid desaturase family protein [Acidimicrobiales bacterium]